MASAKRDIAEYTELPFQSIMPGAESAEVLKNLPGAVELSDSAENVIAVDNKDELCSFLLYQSLLCPVADPDSANKKFKIVKGRTTDGAQ